MGKQFKMPTAAEFLQRKTTEDSPKRVPVWQYLEKEMRQNADKKPYNEKVSNWLIFLKKLKELNRNEAKAKKERLVNDVGPPWYTELSVFQRKILDNLKTCLHQDLIENVPKRTSKVLMDIGLTCKVPDTDLMKAMSESCEDPGVFVWNLYTSIYKKHPSVLCKEYDLNGMILMSALVFIDIDECIQHLEALTQRPKPPPPSPKQKPKKDYRPDVQYGEYLQKNYVPLYTPVHAQERDKLTKPSLEYKFKLKKDSSYENLRNKTSFLRLRKTRNIQDKQTERVCTYKFWEPPCELRNKDPKMVEILKQTKVMSKKAKPRHQAPFKNVQYQIGGVAFMGKRPHFVIQGVVILPTGYIPIHGGHVKTGIENVANVLGYWKYPNDKDPSCDEPCDCLVKWEAAVMDHIAKTTCKCGHYYDFYNQGKATEIFFYPPTKYTPYRFDTAQIYQLDPTENFIKQKVKEALMSREPTPEPSLPTLSTSQLKPEVLLLGFLADLADSPLIIPHLPEANKLNSLKEYVRKRIHGNLTPKMHKRLKLQTMRRWNDLGHMSFKPRTPRIPFTHKELLNMTWAHRKMLQDLSKTTREDFVTRNRKKQLEQARLFWGTLKFDEYPSTSFLDVYFTYMPGRMKDITLLNPYSSDLIPKDLAKTCPLN